MTFCALPRARLARNQLVDAFNPNEQEMSQTGPPKEVVDQLQAISLADVRLLLTANGGLLRADFMVCVFWFSFSGVLQSSKCAALRVDRYDYDCFSRLFFFPFPLPLINSSYSPGLCFRSVKSPLLCS